MQARKASKKADSQARRAESLDDIFYPFDAESLDDLRPSSGGKYHQTCA